MMPTNEVAALIRAVAATRRVAVRTTGASNAAADTAAALEEAERKANDGR